jgi:hypothetical protein
VDDRPGLTRCSLAQTRLQRISGVDIPHEACADSDFSAAFELGILKQVASFGHVTGMEDLPEGPVSVATRARSKEAVVEEGEVEEGGFIMSRAKAEAIAAAARAAVNKAEAAASQRGAIESAAMEEGVAAPEDSITESVENEEDMVDDPEATTTPGSRKEELAVASKSSPAAESKATPQVMHQDPQLGEFVLPSDD